MNDHARPTPERAREIASAGMASVRLSLRASGVVLLGDPDSHQPPLTVAEQRHALHVRHRLPVDGCRFCAQGFEFEPDLEPIGRMSNARKAAGMEPDQRTEASIQHLSSDQLDPEGHRLLAAWAEAGERARAKMLADDRKAGARRRMSRT